MVKDRWRIMKAWRWALALGLLLSCSRTEREVTESINPATLNYYIFTQEIFRLRQGVGTASAERLGDFLPKYDQAIAQGQSLGNEVANMKDVHKHQDLLAALDSSLQTQLTFLQNERQALGALVDYREAEEAKERLEQQISGNTLIRNRLQSELEAETSKSQIARRTLESLKPKLQLLSQKNSSQMRTYNQMVLERKILEYTSPEELLALFDWQKPQPAIKKKAAAKKGAAKKSGGRRKR